MAQDTPLREGLRLSWPNVGDRRRAVVARSPSGRSGHAAPSAPGRGFVNLFSSDVAIHYRLTTSGIDLTPYKPQRDGSVGPSVSRLPSLSMPLLWNPHNLEVSDLDLLRYCESFHISEVEFTNDIIIDLIWAAYSPAHSLPGPRNVRPRCRGPRNHSSPNGPLECFSDFCSTFQIIACFCLAACTRKPIVRL